MLTLIFDLVVLLILASIPLVSSQNEQKSGGRTVFIELAHHLNNRGASGLGSNFDGTGQYFQCPLLTIPPAPSPLSTALSDSSNNNSSQIIRVNNLPFAISSRASYDNVMCQSQFIDLSIALNSPEKQRKRKFGAIYLLGAVNHGPITTDITIVYEDGTQTTTNLNLPDWQVRYISKIHRIDTITCPLNNRVKGSLLVIPVLTEPSKRASYMILPSNGPLGSFQPALHIFAITGISSEPPSSITVAPSNLIEQHSIENIYHLRHQQQQQLLHSSLFVNVISLKSTRRWYDKQTVLAPKMNNQQLLSGSKKSVSFDQNTSDEFPIVTVKVHNTGTRWIKDASVFVKGPLISTQYHGHIRRLAPGHFMEVDVALRSLHRKRVSTSLTVTVTDVYERSLLDVPPVTFNFINVGIEDYKETEASLQEHSTPTWFELAKFGIFIHWGVYSVPAWAPVGKDYAEWYWWNYNQKNSPTYHFHRSFYGPDIEYDDFIPLWNPDQYNPKDWLDLIDASGANYFVFTTKHHDGIALFDTKVTDRSTVKLHPHRDFVRELLTVADRHYPWLKKGLYFSLPEWYHPSYQDYSLNWHGPPKNPYTDKEVTYHGAAEVSDFVNEVQIPQIMELIHNFDPDIMWCDIGGINNSTSWQAKFFNQARQKGKQVTINDRCGNSVSDFETAEYSEKNYIPFRFWESTRGIDPHSFGFNHETRPDQYATVEVLLQELVSTISKGGNFLLNIGPEMSGRISPVVRARLLEMGQWIDRVGESLFTTVPYWVTSADFCEPSQSLYFTQAKDGSAFYIFKFEAPLSKRVVIQTKVPLHENSLITLLSSKRFSKEILQWRIVSTDRLIIYIPEHMLDRNELLWVFKIEAP
ncbi:glycoside hydrolase superfamily [Mycotypha africana]|uniref:glycoside hydrolase superfamily n=1 Tax=Mycotypha africana TaxID=64632 RepID=UPI002301BA4F|nr:glycoside hydrolase superfamily [Mycotypha africana]KAI8984393.1 glycoside hydrolase superfamily [Mycotypha africana]